MAASAPPSRSPAASRRRSGRAECSSSTTSIRRLTALDAFGRWRGDYFASVGVGELVTAVVGAGLLLRGLEEWPGKDTNVPGHLVLAAEKPGG